MMTFNELFLLFFQSFEYQNLFSKNSKILAPQIQGAAGQKLFCEKM